MMRRGFTLLELTMVMVVVAIVAAVAIPRQATALHSRRASVAAQRIVADLEYARAQAITGSASQSLVFSTDAEQYSLPGVGSLSAAAGVYTVDLWDAPFHCDLVSVDFGGGLTLTFDGYGLPDNAGFVIVASGSSQRRVDVDGSSGRGTIQ